MTRLIAANTDDETRSIRDACAGAAAAECAAASTRHPHHQTPRWPGGPDRDVVLAQGPGAPGAGHPRAPRADRVTAPRAAQPRDLCRGAPREVPLPSRCVAAEA